MLENLPSLLSAVLPTLLCGVAVVVVLVVGTARLAYRREVAGELRRLEEAAERMGRVEALKEFDTGVAVVERNLSNWNEHGSGFDEVCARRGHGVDHPGALKRTLSVKAEARKRFLVRPS